MRLKLNRINLSKSIKSDLSKVQFKVWLILVRDQKIWAILSKYKPKKIYKLNIRSIITKTMNKRNKVKGEVLLNDE